MAPFNPEIPVVQPGNYAGASQPIGTPATDQSAAIAIKGLGESFGLAIKGADELVKGVISDQVYAAADKERSGFTQYLSNAKDLVMQGLGKSLGIDPNPDAATAPDGVTDGLDRVESLHSSKDKFSSTAYWGRLTNITKDLRSNFPGYREYIDEQVSKITGHNPANAYMTSLLQDLNRASTSGKEDPDTTKIRNAFYSEDVRKLPGADIQKAQWDKDHNNTRTYKWLAENTALYADVNHTNALLTNARLEREAQSTATIAAAAKLGDGLVKNGLDALTVPISNGEDRVPLMQRLLDLQASGGPSQEESSMLLGMATAGRQAAINAWRTKINSPIDGTKETMATRMSAADYTATEARVIKPFDDAITMITNKDYGMAGTVPRWIEAHNNDLTKRLMTSKSSAEFTDSAIQGRRLLGDTNNVTLLERYYGSDAVAGFGAVIHDNVLGIVTQKQKAITGLPATFNDVLEKFDGNGFGKPNNENGTVKSPTQQKTEQNVIGTVVSQVNIITNPAIKDTSAKLNVAEGAFSKGNRDMINKFVRENRDPITGKVQNGQHAVYDQYINPAMTREMYKLGEKSPQVWQDYKDTGKAWWGGVVFRQDIVELGKIVANGQISIGWDNVNNKWTDPVPNFEAAARKGDPIQDVALRAAYARDVIRRINASLSGIKSIDEAEGGDINARLIRNFLDAGINPQRLPMSMAGETLRALILGNQPEPDAPQKPTEGRGSVKTERVLPPSRVPQNNASAGSSGDISHYTDEGTGGTVQDFTRNPLGLGRDKPAIPVIPKNLTDPANTITGVSVQDIPAIPTRTYRAR